MLRGSEGIDPKECEKSGIGRGDDPPGLIRDRPGESVQRISIGTASASSLSVSETIHQNGLAADMQSSP